MREEITTESLQEFRENFASGRSNLMAMNAVTSCGVLNASRRLGSARETAGEFSLELPQSAVTSQKQSGRCWMYAGFNILRDSVIEKLKVEEFSLSGSYLMFYDKLEKANFFLEQAIKTAGEPSDSRAVSGYLGSARQDGGWWSNFVGLVEKYGVVPQESQPETVCTDGSNSMPPIVAEKLREYARDLRQSFHAGRTMEELRAEKEEMLGTIYRMYCICYGEPVKRFDFKYRPKDGETVSDRGLTPLEFYRKYIGVDLRQYVTVSAGATNGRNTQHYRVPGAGGVLGTMERRYVSVSIETLKAAVLRQLKAKRPVWFTCDVDKRSWRDKGIMDENLYDIEDLFDIDLSMSREDRFNYGEAHASHAMVLKGVDVGEDGAPLLWRVENSWGPDVGKKGMFVMTDGWFDRYVYEAAVCREYLPDEVLAAWDGQAVELQPWQKLV